MNKLFNLLLGPELLWLLFYFFFFFIIKMTGSPVKSMDNFWENTYFTVPLILVPLTFALYYIPGVIHSWLLLRIWIACLIGGHYVLSKTMGSHTEQGPGIGTAYIFGLVLIIVVLVAGSIFAAIKFR